MYIDWHGEILGVYGTKTVKVTNKEDEFFLVYYKDEWIWVWAGECKPAGK